MGLVTGRGADVGIAAHPPRHEVHGPVPTSAP